MRFDFTPTADELEIYDQIENLWCIVDRRRQL